MRLLLAEDDDELRDVLDRSLRAAGYMVDAVADGETATEFLTAYEYAVCVVDWTMPGRSGLQVVDWMRRRGIATPVLLLTAHDEPGDRVRGLDGGADDYLGKPFDHGELLARLRALLRRGERVGEPEFRQGRLRLDPATHDVAIGVEPVELTPREFALLELLMRRSPAVVTRREMALHAWPEEADALGSNTIEVHMARLRAKLARADAAIETVRGTGYRMAGS